MLLKKQVLKIFFFSGFKKNNDKQKFESSLKAAVQKQKTEQEQSDLIGQKLAHEQKLSAEMELAHQQRIVEARRLANLQDISQEVK